MGYFEGKEIATLAEAGKPGKKRVLGTFICEAVRDCVCHYEPSQKQNICILGGQDTQRSDRKFPYAKPMSNIPGEGTSCVGASSGGAGSGGAGGGGAAVVERAVVAVQVVAVQVVAVPSATDFSNHKTNNQPKYFNQKGTKMLRHRILVWFTVVFIVLGLGIESFSQVQLELEKKRIDQAHECFANLIALRSELPTRWAALQKRESVNTYNLDKLEITTKNIEEFCAHDAKSKTHYTRVSLLETKTVVTNSNENWSRRVCAFTQPGLLLHRVDNQSWSEVRMIPNIGYSASDPFSWCCGFVNTADAGLLTNNLLPTIAKRECLASKLTKEGHLFTVWGDAVELRPLPNSAVYLIFEKNNQLVREYGCLFFETSDSRVSLAKDKFEIVERGYVTWEYFGRNGVRDTKKDLPLPTRVRVFSTMNPKEEIECDNQIFWKLGADVPENIL